MQLKPIAQQVVVVMGAASGIGRETALRFARRGARVVVSARSEPDLLSLVEQIRAEGGEATAVPADVTEFAQVKAVAESAMERYGRLDAWVHVAGVGLWATLEETRPEEWRQVVDVNLNGQAYGAMAALPHLKRDGGALIHVSSVEAQFAMPFQSAYAASKHGVHGLLKSLRLELKRAGLPISVTEIMPAGTSTPIFDVARTRLGVKPKPFPPVYAPGVVADAILHAAEHPTRELVTGGFSKAGLVAQAIAPRLMDGFLLFAGFGTQRTQEAKGEHTPTSLFAPLEGVDEVQGSLTPSRSWSSWTWLETHPAVKGALLAGAVGALAVLAGRLARGGGATSQADADERAPEPDSAPAPCPRALA